MNPFLENLKKSVDAGEFNSEAAKKIIEISKLAETKASTMSTEELQERLDNVTEASGVKRVSEKEALELNSQYDEKMKEQKKQDEINMQVATIIDMDDMIVASIRDVLSYFIELEDRFKKEFEEENPMFKDFKIKIEEIKNKYKTIINN